MGLRHRGFSRCSVVRVYEAPIRLEVNAAIQER
jgi:hypothetical protein